MCRARKTSIQSGTEQEHVMAALHTEAERAALVLLRCGKPSEVDRAVRLLRAAHPASFTPVLRALAALLAGRDQEAADALSAGARDAHNSSACEFIDLLLTARQPVPPNQAANQAVLQRARRLVRAESSVPERLPLTGGRMLLAELLLQDSRHSEVCQLLTDVGGPEGALLLGCSLAGLGQRDAALMCFKRTAGTTCTAAAAMYNAAQLLEGAEQLAMLSACQAQLATAGSVCLHISVGSSELSLAQVLLARLEAMLQQSAPIEQTAATATQLWAVKEACWSRDFLRAVSSACGKAMLRQGNGDEAVQMLQSAAAGNAADRMLLAEALTAAGR